MYEFSSKEDREKFKKTEYGKKTNLWLIIAMSVAIPVFIIVYTTLLIIIVEATGISIGFLSFLQLLVMASISIIAYYEGKRDGAIEQFKRSNKNKKIDN